MLGTTAIDGMGEDELLVLAGELAGTIVDAETGLLRVAYQWAVIHSPDRGSGSDLPGREKARLYGGDGTPVVSEFAAAELGARIGRTTFAAGQLMADALDLVHRGTDLWARVQTGRVRASYARHVVARTRHLSQDEAQYVATAVAESADGRIPWTRFEALVEAKIAQANPAVAREKEERAAKAAFAKKLRAQAHGMGSYLIRGPIPVIDLIAATVDSYSDAIAEDFPDLTDDQRGLQAILMLLTPGADQDPTKLAETAPVVNLFVHLYPSEPIARLEGHGPVTTDWVRDILGPQCRFKIQPVLDLAGQAPVDAYEIPERHRQAVHLMTPADIFPFSSSLSRTQQVDHTIPYHQHGRSAVGNYGPMTVTHHRIKTHGNWQVKQPFPGIYLWRDPHGTHYLVDHTGTRQLPETNKRDQDLMVIELWHTPVELDWAA